MKNLRYFGLRLRPTVYVLFLKFIKWLKPVYELSLNVGPFPRNLDLEQLIQILSEKTGLYKLYLNLGHPASYDSVVG